MEQSGGEGEWGEGKLGSGFILKREVLSKGKYCLESGTFNILKSNKYFTRFDFESCVFSLDIFKKKELKHFCLELKLQT